VISCGCLQDRFVMFRDMHLARNKQLSRLHERLAREFNKQRMDDNDRRLEALKANDFEAYKELLRQTYGPSTDDERFAGKEAAPSCLSDMEQP
jgi:SWI/SNF-related matrix-associated actin-dependent regulator of chromatin subfamily A protein 2/4